MVKKILVTGAAGFIGSNLTIRLLQLGYHVIGYDNLSQGSIENLSEVLNLPNFSFTQGDILDYEKLRACAHDVEAIFHMAAFKIPRYTDALDTLKINGFGSDIVAKVAVDIKAHLIAASTSDVYGKNPETPFSEDSHLVMGAPDVKRWAYAISKMFEEQLLYAYKDRYGLDITLVRFFGGYGPHQHLTWWGGPQSVFIDLALEKKCLEIHGDGQQTRTFTYISDHIDGLVKILENPNSRNQVFNLGSFEEITILNLAKKIWYLINGDQDLPVKLIPYETFGKYEDVRRRVPDLSKSQEMLGYTPLVSLEEGLIKTIEWQASRRKKKVLA